MTGPRWSSLHLSLVHLAVAGGLCVAAVCELLDAGPLREVHAIYVFPGLATLFALSGLLAWWRRPGNRLGPLLVATGAAWLVSGLQNSGVPAATAVGLVTASLPLAMLVHLLHAAPGGRLRDRTSRVVVGAGYATALLLQVPLWAYTPSGPPVDVLLVSPRPDLVSTGEHVQNTAGGLVTLLTVALLVARLRGYTRQQRALLGPLLAFGIVALLALPVGGDVLRPRVGVVRAVEIEAVPIALVPLGFLAVVLRGGFARVGQLTGLVSALTESSGSRRDLQEALGRALGDPSAQLLQWDPEQDGYVDTDGRPAPPPETAGARASTTISSAGDRLGALVYDPQLTEDPGAVEPVARVAAIALDRERLAQEAAESREALRVASSRLLEEADRERRRIAQDLHDGLQGSLVRLSLSAHQLADDGAPAAQLAADIDRAAADLRALVHGVMPAPLVERGLPAALQDLVAGLPVRSRLAADLPGRLPAPVESTAYFVVAEALTNVVKHARAREVGVDLRVVDGTLRIEVADDGRGGATTTPAGAGLTGLRDRLEVLGGQLRVASGAVGTRLEAELPCAW